MRPSAVLQHIQHIASLGLADAVAVPEMLTALQMAVPAAYASFYWIDPIGNAERIFAAPDVLAEMARNQVDFLTLDPANEPTLHRVVAMGQQLDNASAMSRAFDFTRSVIVNEVMPAMGVAMGIDLVVRRDGEAKAVLYLNREIDAPGYSTAERRLLAAVHPYFAHALGPGSPKAGQVADPEVEREAVLTVSTDGAIITGAGDAAALLAELANPALARTSGDRLPSHLPPGLMPLLKLLDEAVTGRPASPARIALKGHRGEYRARAYPLASGAQGQLDTATVIVSHHLPREVTMLRRVFALPLTPVERRVAFAVGEGRGSDDIAQQLGLTAQTLRGYLKTIYARTGAGGREALAQLLRA